MTINREHLATQKILDLILDECRYWQGRDEARRGSFAILYAAAKEIAARAQAAPEAEPVAINQWQYGDAWIDASEADVANARRLGKITRVLYTAPQHDAELVELLMIAAGSIREICKERDVPLPKSTLNRIDAKLATLSAKP